MQKIESKNGDLERTILDLIGSCRARVLDIAEAQLGSSSTWKIIRSQLLNLLGEKGLSGDVQRAIAEARRARERS